MIRVALVFLSAAVAFGQLRPTVSQPTNVDFSEGEIGQMPTGWNMPPLVLGAGYRAELQQHCGRFSRCVAYVAPAVIGTIRAAELQQTFPAAPYIGKAVRFSAWLRLIEGNSSGYLHIRMRVDYAGKVDMRDSVEPPVRSEDWQQREVRGRVNPGAVSISIWARYVPSGFARVANAKFEVVDDANTPAPVSIGAATAAFPVADALGQPVRFNGSRTRNVSTGSAGLWWRVDGAQQQVLSFDNSSARLIEGRPVSGNGDVPGARGLVYT